MHERQPGTGFIVEFKNNEKVQVMPEPFVVTVNSETDAPMLRFDRNVSAFYAKLVPFYQDACREVGILAQLYAHLIIRDKTRYRISEKMQVFEDEEGNTHFYRFVSRSPNTRANEPVHQLVNLKNLEHRRQIDVIGFHLGIPIKK